MSMLYSERLRLRAIEPEDLSRLMRWVNDPEVTAHLGSPISVFPFSNADESNWIAELSKSPHSERPMLIEIRSAEDAGEEAVWIPIGDISFHRVDWITRSAELGIMIGEKQYWDKGYGSEAIRLMFTHGFNGLNLHRIFLGVHPDNSRAKHAYEKLGFKHDGRHRDAIYRNGRYYDLLIMSILKQEWQTLYQGKADSHVC